MFASLVTDDKDAIGLIAYALYKHKKHTLATTLRNEGREENDIQTQVQTFHDQTLQHNSLDDYRDKATNFLNQMIKEVETREKEKYQKEKAKSDKEHKSTLTKEKTKLFNKIKNYQEVNREWYEKLGSWLLSGIPSIVSSFIVTCLLLGASMFLVSEAKRQEVFTELASKYLGIQQGAQPTKSSANQKPQPPSR